MKKHRREKGRERGKDEGEGEILEKYFRTISFVFGSTISEGTLMPTEQDPYIIH